MADAERFLKEAIDLARGAIAAGDRPFGAVVVKDGVAIAAGVNAVSSTNDPTAHAELMAIRAASQALGTPRLDGCAVYASGQPCPMCLAAMYLAGIREGAYAYSLEDGAPHGLTSADIYAEFAKPQAERALDLRYRPVRPEGEPDLYDQWREATSG
ncbi:MAG: nucleoside deaminase [Thermomicrobiales bacterium]|nr:nucleoside deaminase [Thermomicrobiales bacterium]